MQVDKTKPKGKSRNRPGNRHDDDKVLLGGYVYAEVKALAQLTTNKLKIKNNLALLVEGLHTMATKAGIMENGKIKPEYKTVIAELANGIRVRNKLARAAAAAKAAQKKEGTK